VWPGLRDITHPVPIRRRIRFAINLFVNPLRAIIHGRAWGAEILHLSTIPHVTFAIWSRTLKRAGIKLVATAHDVRRSQGLICYPYEIKELKRLYRTCDALFVHSEYQKKDLMDFAGVSPDKIHIVPHGPYYHGPPQGDKIRLRKRYGIPLDKQVALFFGDIRPDKNLDLFLRAMVPFKDRLFLVVAGQPKSRRSNVASSILALVNCLDLKENVFLRFEYIPDAEVPNLFELSDFVVMPYSRAFTSQSGVLNVALAHRRPVLASRTPTIEESLNRFKVGVLCEPDSLDSLRDSLGEILRLSFQNVTWEIDQYLEAVTWEHNSVTCSKVYRRIINNHSTSTDPCD
jgi:glycosyltransferase involved in cell wall biosynthesis